MQCVYISLVSLLMLCTLALEEVKMFIVRLECTLLSRSYGL